MDFNKIKKIELHLHLDGSVRVSTLSDILGISLEEAKKNMVVSSSNKDLTDYLKKFDLPLKVMQTEKNLTRISKELAEDLYNDNIIYAEVRFAPMFHTKEGLSMDDVVKAVLEGFNSQNMVKINLILCMMRGANVKDNVKTMEVAKRYLNKGVVAVDLAGDEKAYPTFDYEDLFTIAKANKIPFTIHAGEAANFNSVEDAIRFGTKRIGHGVNSIYNRETVRKLIENRITLEVCPTSNVQTKVVGNYGIHPIKKLINEGVLVTINTDNRTVSNITLSKEYQLLHDNFGFNVDDFKNFNLNAIVASFLNDEDKNKLKNIILNDQRD